MEKQIYFRRPFTIVKEEDQGSYVFAIVVFQKIPMIQNTRVLDPKEASEKGCCVETTVVKYRYHLQIDLWLLVLRFSWERNVNSLRSAEPENFSSNERRVIGVTSKRWG